MDRRRAAGALLALAACVAYTAAAPTTSNQTSLDLYDGAAEGCYYNFQHYGEGDRIMTNEPCLNCTCHNRMLMCYLRVCPFTKPIGQDCTVEKRADQCCPIVTCPDVPVDLLTSTSTSSPAEYGATGVGKLDTYGCSIHGRYFPEGSKVPSTPNKPCEHCYCIRNMTTCVMQECTLHVDGCTPIYHKDVCCPVRYSCDHTEDEILGLDDMTTTVRPTPGFLLTTTTLSPVTQITQDCVHDEQIFGDGALIKTEKACEHCYCMKGDIVCVVQECGTPMENEGKNCTSLAPREGQCCPDTYICEGDELGPEITEIPPQSITEETSDKVTLLPSKTVFYEGSGITNEPGESYTGMPIIDSETEGSGEEELQRPINTNDVDSVTPQILDELFESTKEMFEPTSIITKAEPQEITTELDNGHNTIPSEYIEDKVTESNVLKTTVSYKEHKVTEPTITSSDKQYHVQEPITNISDLTTEKSFRKDDQGEVTKEYPPQKEIEEQTTMAVYEINVTGVTLDYEHTSMPAESDLKLTTNLSPEHVFTTEEIFITKEPSTYEEPSKESVTLATNYIEITSTIHTPEKVKISENTESPDVELLTVTPPGRIPGEGDCLYHGVTYTNESNVPSSNKCDLSCKCISSIVKCEPVICSPTPEFMDNCQEVYDSSESCCPTYICQSKETEPPQAHSQMSGTDSPVQKPTTECKDSECQLPEEKDVSEVSKLPEVSGCDGNSCNDAPIIVTQPSLPQNKDQSCNEPDGCQVSLEDNCQGDNCKTQPEKTKDVSTYCDGEDNCIKTNPETGPCESDSCHSIKEECQSTDCTTPMPLAQTEESCEEENGCRKPVENIDEECTDETCRRMENANLGNKPSKCVGSTCLPQTADTDNLQSTPGLIESPSEKTNELTTEAEYNYKSPDHSVKSESSTGHVTQQPDEVTLPFKSLSTIPEGLSSIIPDLSSKGPEALTTEINSQATYKDDQFTYVTLTPEKTDTYETEPLPSIAVPTEKPDILAMDHTEFSGSTGTISEWVTNKLTDEQETQTALPTSPVVQENISSTMKPYESSQELDTSLYDTEIKATNSPAHEKFTETPESEQKYVTDVPSFTESVDSNNEYTTKLTENEIKVQEPSKDKVELETGLPELKTTVAQNLDKTNDISVLVTELPKTTINEESEHETEKFMTSEHTEEENDISTEYANHKVSTEQYEKTQPEIQPTLIPESLQNENEIKTEIPIANEEFITDIPGIITMNQDNEQSDKDIYTENPELQKTENLVSATEKMDVTPHHKEEENEIPTELPERKVTVEDYRAPSVKSESTPVNKLLETTITYEQEKEPVTVKQETTSMLLEYSQYEPETSEHLTELPETYATKTQKETEATDSIKVTEQNMLSSETESEYPETSTAEILKATIQKEYGIPEMSTEPQPLTSKLSTTNKPEVEEETKTEWLPTDQHKLDGSEIELTATEGYKDISKLSEPIGTSISASDHKLSSIIPETVTTLDELSYTELPAEILTVLPKEVSETIIPEILDTVTERIGPIPSITAIPESQEIITSVADVDYTTGIPVSHITKATESFTDILKTTASYHGETNEAVTATIHETHTEVPEPIATKETEKYELPTSSQNPVTLGEITDQKSTEYSDLFETLTPGVVEKQQQPTIGDYDAQSVSPKLPATESYEEPTPGSFITETEITFKPESIETEQKQSATEIPKEIIQPGLKEFTINEEELKTTQSPHQMTVKLDTNAEIPAHTSSVNEISTNQPETVTEELEPSRKSEQYPTLSVTEMSLEPTEDGIIKNQISKEQTTSAVPVSVSELQTNTYSLISETESPITIESETSEIPNASTEKYKDGTDNKYYSVPEEYEPSTKPEEIVKETKIPVYSFAESSSTQTPKISEITEEYDISTEEPKSSYPIEETYSETTITSKPIDTFLPESKLSTIVAEVSTAKPEEVELHISETPDLEKVTEKSQEEKITPTDIPETGNEYSTESSEVSYTEPEYVNKEQAVTKVPDVFITQTVEEHTEFTEGEGTVSDAKSSGTEPSAQVSTGSSHTNSVTPLWIVNKVTSTETPVVSETESEGIYTEPETNIPELSELSTKSSVLATSVSEEIMTKEPGKDFEPDTLLTVQPEITIETTNLSVQEELTKSSEQPVTELQEGDAEIIEPVDKVEDINTTPYLVELVEHTHKPLEPNKQTASSITMTDKAETEKDVLSFTELPFSRVPHYTTPSKDMETFGQTASYDTPVEDFLTIAPGTQEESDRIGTKIPEIENTYEISTSASEKPVEHHSTLSSVYSTDRSMIDIATTETSLVTSFSSVEPSIPEEELILVTTKTTTARVEEVPEAKPTEHPEEIFTEVPKDMSSKVPEEKPIETPDEKPSVTSEEKTTEVSQEMHSTVSEKIPSEISETTGEITTEIPSAVLETKPGEVPEENPSEIQEEIPNNVLDEKPSEITTQIPSKTSEPKPGAGLEVSPSDILEEKPSEDLGEKPSETTTEISSKIPEVKPVEGPEEKPSEIPEEKPNEDLDKKPSEITSEIPNEIPEIKPGEGPEEKPSEIPEEKLSEDLGEKPSEMTTEIPSVIPELMPVEGPKEKPSEIPEEKPNEIAEEKPSGAFDEKSSEITTESSSEVPEEKPSEVPEEKPNEILVETPIEVPVDKPSEISDTIPSESPEEKPSETPVEKTSEVLEEKPNEISDEIPSGILEEKPAEIPVEKTSEIPGEKQSEIPEEEPGTGSYGQEPDYVEEDQAFGPGTCRYGGKVYVSAQQIPREDPCDFCFCFRSDIICLQQSCPPPIHGCHEEPIQGFCCPRYECPVSMATTLNVTTTTTTTTTTLPPHFPTHAYKGAAQRKGCLIKGHTYKVGEVVRASSGPCLHCTCGGDGQMKCDPKACTPEPMLRQMIAAAVSSKRRR